MISSKAINSAKVFVHYPLSASVSMSGPSLLAPRLAHLPLPPRGRLFAVLMIQVSVFVPGIASWFPARLIPGQQIKSIAKELKLNVANSCVHSNAIDGF